MMTMWEGQSAALREEGRFLPPAKICGSFELMQGYCDNPHSPSAVALEEISDIVWLLPRTAWAEGLSLYNFLWSYYSERRDFFLHCPEIKKEEIDNFVSFDDYKLLNGCAGEVAQLSYLSFVLRRVGAAFLVSRKLSQLGGCLLVMRPH